MVYVASAPSASTSIMEVRATSIEYQVGVEPSGAPARLKPIWQRLLDRAIDLFLVLWLFVATGAIIPLLVGGESAADLTEDDRGVLRLINVAPFVSIGPLLIGSRAKAVTTLLLRNPALLLLLLWVWCSVLWSVAPDISVRRALALTVYTLLACYLVVRHDFDWILKRLAWLYLALLLISVLFILVLPSLSAMPGGWGLRGIYPHKNGMGRFLVELAILLPPAISKRLIHPVLGSAGLLIALALLVPVNSATAIIILPLVLATQAAVGLWRLPARFAATVTAFGIATACLLILPLLINPEVVFELLGRNTTLTGRTDIWLYVWQWIQQRPVIGYGYGAFFAADEHAAYVAAIFPWEPSSAHNGYLELLLTIGPVGLALFLVFIGSGLVRTAMASTRLDPTLMLVLLPLLVGYTSRAITESSLLGHAGITWVLVVIFTVSATPNLPAIRSR
jgi:exopolysaccharide production protein ExoQ